MADHNGKDSVQRTFTIQLPVDQAFDVFTKEMNTWWPKEYTWAKDTLDTIGIELRKGGRCFERGPNGFECDWGRVIEWNPPQHLVITWQISFTRVPEPNPEKASIIELKFKQDGSQTRVEFEHREFSNHGESAAEYCKAMDSPQGWDYILERYKKAAINN